MTSEQIRKITESWEQVAQDPNVVLKFYSKLFEIAPETKKYFPQDLSKQSEKLAYTLGFVVGNLDRLDEIKQSIEDLGRHHNRLKIKAEYYGYVKDALISTIVQGLGDKYEEGTREAWDVALTHVAMVMINAPAKREPRFTRLFAKLFPKSAPSE